MEAWVIPALIVLAAVNLFCYVKLRKVQELHRANPILFTFLPFLAYGICVLIFDLRIPWYVLLLGFVAQFLQTFFGYYLDKFEMSMRFDRYQHAFACFSYALLIYCTLTAALGKGISRIYGAILTGAIGETLGVFIELFEFTVDSTGKSPVTHQKSLKDTDYDLLFNTIGSVCAAVFAFFLLP